QGMAAVLGRLLEGAHRLLRDGSSGLGAGHTIARADDETRRPWTACPAVLVAAVSERLRGLAGGLPGNWRARQKAEALTAYPSATRAFRKIRIHGLSSPQPSGCHDIWAVRNTRSGCGIRTVKRPSAVVSAVRPSGEPFGLTG